MNTVVALILTFFINGEIYQDVPESFYTREDCQQFKVDNNLGGEFTCVVVETTNQY